MSKQKIILFTFLLILVIGSVLFYFFIKNQSYVAPVSDESNNLDKNTEILKELQSFKKPTTEILIPQSPETVDQTIKTDEEIKTEVDAVVVPQKTEQKSDADILKLLTDPNIK